MPQDGTLKLKIGDDGPWKNCGITNPGGGTLSLQVADLSAPPPTPPETLDGAFTGTGTAQAVYIPGGLVESDPYRGSRYDLTNPASCTYAFMGTVDHPLLTHHADPYAVLGEHETDTLGFIHVNEPLGGSYVRNFLSTALPRLDIDEATFRTLDVWSIARRCPQAGGNYSGAVVARLSYPGCGGSVTHPNEVTNGMAPRHIKSPGPITSLPGHYPLECSQHMKWFGSNSPAMFSYNNGLFPGWWDDAWDAYTSVPVGEMTPLLLEVSNTAGDAPIDISFLAVVFGDSLTDPWPSGSTEVTDPYEITGLEPFTYGGTGGAPVPAEWHTADNNEPPPPGKPWGDGGVEDGWVHVSWMRLKDQPGSGRTGRLKLRIADPAFPELPSGPPWAGGLPIDEDAGDLVTIPASVVVTYEYGTPTGTDPSNWSDYNSDSNYFSAASQQFYLVQCQFYLRREAHITEDFFASPWVVARVRDRDGQTVYVNGILEADPGSPGGFFQGLVPSMPSSGDLPSDVFTTFHNQITSWTATDRSRAWTTYSSVAVGEMTPVFVRLRPSGSDYTGLDVTFLALTNQEITALAV